MMRELTLETARLIHVGDTVRFVFANGSTKKGKCYNKIFCGTCTAIQFDGEEKNYFAIRVGNHLKDGAVRFEILSED